MRVSRVAKGWIKGAIRHKGALKEAASRAGETTREYAGQHKHDSGKTGARSRLALTLMGMNHPADRRYRKRNS